MARFLQNSNSRSWRHVCTKLPAVNCAWQAELRWERVCDYCRCSSQRCIYLDVHAPLSLSLSLSLSEFVCSSLAPCLWCLCVWRRSRPVMFLYRPFFFTVMRRGMQTALACPSGDLIASRWVWLLDFALRLLFWFFFNYSDYFCCLFVRLGFFGGALPFTGTAPPTSKPTHPHPHSPLDHLPTFKHPL